MRSHVVPGVILGLGAAAGAGATQVSDFGLCKTLQKVNEDGTPYQMTGDHPSPLPLSSCPAPSTHLPSERFMAVDWWFAAAICGPWPLLCGRGAGPAVVAAIAVAAVSAAAAVNAFARAYVSARACARVCARAPRYLCLRACTCRGVNVRTPSAGARR
jgi:hypothetical protein